MEKEKLSEHVWITDAFIRDELAKPFVSKKYIVAEGQEIIGLMDQSAEKNIRGENLSAENFPKQLFAQREKTDEARTYKNLPDLFSGGFWVVSERVAEIFQAMDTGGGGVFPTELFQEDGKTPVEGNYYCLNFGNKKTAFALEHSPRARSSPASRVMAPPFNMKDDDIAVFASALQGPDIWIDPTLRASFFLSDRLWQAIKSAGAGRAFNAERCRVI